VNGQDAVPELTCEEVREMAGAFVLGALAPADDAAVRAHLATCADPHEELAELGGVLSALAESVPIVEPPAGLKARILAAAAADLAVEPAARDGGSAGVASSPAGVASSPAPDAVPVVPTPAPDALGPTASVPPTRAPEPTPFPTTSEREARRSRTSATGWIVRIAAVIAIVGLLGWNLLLQGQINAAKSFDESVAAVLDAAAKPGALTAVLTADGGPGSGLAAVSTTGEVTMAMRDLAPTTGDTVYETWVIGGDNVPVPLGSFKVGNAGTASFEAGGVPSANGIVLALTLEPGPGAQTPTLPLISKGVATTAG
jgi:anti-sigma-K factor RskA